MKRQLTTLLDLHFLLIAPNLGAEWLFDGARQYWDRFRPTVISDLRLVALIPSTRSVGVTVLARRDTIGDLGVALAQDAPYAYFDPLVFDTLDQARAALNERAASNQPYGSPLLTPFPTFDASAPNSPAIPTPLLPATRAPAGFITATPLPPPTALTGTPEQTPLRPTPGPITGGS
ncbi:MAG: hypothetical protein SF162_11970 [bacterium]|nr:hypothetical protein [bacterium]